MTNGLPIAAPNCCPSNGGGDLLPLLLAGIVLWAGHIALQEFRKRKGKPEMKNVQNLAIVAAVLVAAAAVFALKHREAPPLPPAPAPSVPAQATRLPRLVDLGATKCIPCKLMAPILAELKTTYAGQLQVEFIDIWENPDAGDQYEFQTIPTQIFYDAQGKEVFRHEGFFPKEDILATWKELGVNLSAPAPQAP